MSIFGYPSRHPSIPRNKPRGVVYRGEGCRAALPPSQLKTTNIYVYKASVTCGLWAQKLFRARRLCFGLSDHTCTS